MLSYAPLRYLFRFVPFLKIFSNDILYPRICRVFSSSLYFFSCQVFYLSYLILVFAECFAVCFFFQSLYLILNFRM